MSRNKSANRSIIVALVLALILAGLLTVISIRILGTVSIVVPKHEISAFQPYLADDYTTVSISKRDLNIFGPSIVDNLNTIKNKIPKRELRKGLPIVSQDFLNPSDPKTWNSVVSSKDDDLFLLPLKKENSLNGMFQTGSSINLYLVYYETKTVNDKQIQIPKVITLKKNLVVKNKIETNDGYYIQIEVPNDESPKFLLLKYILDKNQGYITITLPGAGDAAPIVGNQQSNEVLNYDDFVKELSQSDYFKFGGNVSSSNTNQTKAPADTQANNNQTQNNTNTPNKK